MLKRLWKDESGIAMTEYIIILVVVAIGAIGVIKVFGTKIREMFTESTNALPGVTTNEGGSDGGVMDKVGDKVGEKLGL